MQYIDIHSHINFPEFDQDREEVITRMRESDTRTIAVGTDYESSKRAVELADTYEEVYACIGIHPVDDQSQVFGKDKFEALIKHPKVVAIGECGLDYFRIDKTELEIQRQKKLFLDHVQFALEYDKPLMIHSRAAYPELLDMLEPLVREHGDRLRGDVHFFAGDMDIAKRFLNIGFTLSFTGVITFTHDYDEVIRSTPLNMIMSETDAPFVAPVPYRGKRNEPGFVREVVKKIAEIRGEDVEEVREKLLENARRIFSLPK
jgi:TatD DNase family protein